MIDRAAIMTDVIIEKFKRSIQAALIVSKSTPSAGKLVVRATRFLAIKRITTMEERIM